LFNCRVYCIYGLSRLQVTGVPKLLRGMIQTGTSSRM
jgi:hypothetical protein